MEPLLVRACTKSSSRLVRRRSGHRLNKRDWRPSARPMRTPVVAHTSLYDANNSFSVDVPSVDVPRFEAGPSALNYLKREGYVVIKNMNATEVAHARQLLWSFLEGTGKGVRRDKPKTWVRSAPNQYGIVWNNGVGHSRLAWFIRTRPKLLEMFARVWNTSDLIASFEGFSWLPPRAYESSWRLGEAWFHTDQNGLSRPGRQTVQSLTSLYDQDEHTGAFVIVPRSHKHHSKVTRRVYAARPQTPHDQQFLMIPANDEILHKPRRPHLVRCKAGDSILWESRAVHCSTPSLLGAPSEAAAEVLVDEDDGRPRPARVAVYNSLSPRSRASEEVLLQRQAALITKQTCTHWPFEMTCLEPPQSSVKGEAPSDPLTRVTSVVKQLVGYTDGQLERWLNANAAERREAVYRTSALPALHEAATLVDESAVVNAAEILFGTHEGVTIGHRKCARKRPRSLLDLRR